MSLIEMCASLFELEFEMDPITSPVGSCQSLCFPDWFSTRVWRDLLLAVKLRCGLWNVSGNGDRHRQHYALPLEILALLFLTTNCAALTFAQAQDRSLAIVNGRSITQREVDNLVIAQTLPLEEKLYAIRKAALENLITSKLLE